MQLVGSIVVGRPCCRVTQIVPCAAPSRSGSDRLVVDATPINASFAIVPSDGSIPNARLSSPMCVALVRLSSLSVVVVVVVLARILHPQTQCYAPASPRRSLPLLLRPVPRVLGDTWLRVWARKAYCKLHPMVPRPPPSYNPGKHARPLPLSVRRWVVSIAPLPYHVDVKLL